MKKVKSSARRKRTAVKDLATRKAGGVKGGVDPINGSKRPGTLRPADPVNG